MLYGCTEQRLCVMFDSAKAYQYCCTAKQRTYTHPEQKLVYGGHFNRRLRRKDWCERKDMGAHHRHVAPELVDATIQLNRLACWDWAHNFLNCGETHHPARNQSATLHKAHPSLWTCTASSICALYCVPVHLAVLNESEKQTAL